MGQEDDNKVIWTGILMRFITAVLSTISVIALVSITDGDDPLIIQIAVLESIAILASAFDTFMYWFQGKLLGKYTSIAGVISYLGMSLYRIYLLANNADILWFAFATSVDTLLLSFVLMIFYVRKNGFRPKVSLRLIGTDRNPIFEDRSDHVKTDVRQYICRIIFCSTGDRRIVGNDTVSIYPVCQSDPV